MSEQRKYRSWTAQQKIEIVLAGLRGDRSVKDVCREHEISDTLFYSWRELLRKQRVRPRARIVFLSGTETAKKLSEASAYGVVIEKNVIDLRAELHAAAAKAP